MINQDLIINGQSISKEEDITAFFQKDHFSCKIDEYCLEVEFSPDGNAFIGWLNGDEELYYFDNGSGNTEPVALCINFCPEERMMCYDRDVMKDIVMYFCETGLRNPEYNWIRDACLYS